MKKEILWCAVIGLGIGYAFAGTLYTLPIYSTVAPWFNPAATQAAPAAAS